MRKLVLLLIYFFSLFHTASLVYAGEYDDIEQYGFHFIEDSSEKLHLQSRDHSNLIISKERFKDSKSALQFCKQQNLPLGNIAIPLLLAMSGVTENHVFIKDAVVFDFSATSNSEYKSGIWSWANRSGNFVSLIFDGKGMDDVYASVSELNRVFRTHISLPAVCSDMVLNLHPSH